MRVQFSNWTFYNGRDLKGYLLDFSLVDIGFCRVYPDDSPVSGLIQPEYLLFLFLKYFRHYINFLRF